MHCKKINKVFLMIAIINGILGFASKLVYREYIYNNAIYDYGLADCLPSFFCIVGLAFLVSSFYKPSNEQNIVIFICGGVTGSLFYEFEQLSSSMVFDYKDIIAIIAGAVFSLILYKYLVRKYKGKELTT